MRKGKGREKTPAELRWEKGQYVARPLQNDSCMGMNVKVPPTLPKAICSVKSIENWALDPYSSGREVTYHHQKQREQNTTTIQYSEEFVEGRKEGLSPSDKVRQSAEALFQEFKDERMPSPFTSTPLTHLAGSPNMFESPGMSVRVTHGKTKSKSCLFQCYS